MEHDLVQPYGFKSNPNSILDVADIVFVNPVNTGYSRMVPNRDGEMPDRSQFFGINEDIAYLSGWINTFVTRKNRWESPKYIIGESYGGTRVMGLSLALHDRFTDAPVKLAISNALFVPLPSIYSWNVK